MENEIEHRKGILKWLPLAILSLALTIIILDTTILNVSLRAIIQDLHTDIQSMQWVITAYSLMLAAFTITGGRLGDLFGRKKMFAVGAIIFAIGSFITSISPTVGYMIAGEAIIEGIGAALMLPATTSLLVSNYKGRDRQIGFGIWGAIAGASAAIGPVVGGWLTTYFSWRWAFRINVVVAILLVIGSTFIMEMKDKEEKPTIDFVGILLSAVGMFTLVFGFIKASTYGWLTMKEAVTIFGFKYAQNQLSLVPILIFLGLIILGIFALWENHMTKSGRTPLVSLSLFKNSQFTLGILITAILALGQSGVMFAIPVFLQGVNHLDALSTGFAMLPMTLTLLVASPLSAVVSKNIAPKRIIQIGLVLNVIALIVLRASISIGATAWSLAPGFILFGAGFGLMISQISNISMSAVSVEESGEASGVNGTMRQVGSTLGSAIMGAVLLSVLTSSLISGVNKSTIIPNNAKATVSSMVSSQTSNIEFGIGNNVANRTMPLQIGQEITRISQQATVDANRATLLIGVFFILLGLALSTKLPNSKNIETSRSAASPH
ncbi:MAG TPA: MFS transporter [Patescibacteria group bacterium]|nr:MFS transporter [Patescibacteria group bacterium]